MLQPQYQIFYQKKVLAETVAIFIPQILFPKTVQQILEVLLK
jgi:hypothetical protein